MNVRRSKAATEGLCRDSSAIKLLSRSDNINKLSEAGARDRKPRIGSNSNGLRKSGQASRLRLSGVIEAGELASSKQRRLADAKHLKVLSSAQVAEPELEPDRGASSSASNLLKLLNTIRKKISVASNNPPQTPGDPGRHSLNQSLGGHRALAALSMVQQAKAGTQKKAQDKSQLACGLRRTAAESNGA